MKEADCPVCGTHMIWSSGRGTKACPKCHPDKGKGGGKGKWAAKKEDVKEVA